MNKNNHLRNFNKYRNSKIVKESMAMNAFVKKNRFVCFSLNLSFFESQLQEETAEKFVKYISIDTTVEKCLKTP